ncbi:MAG: hypothetical protein WCI72_03740 [archaeon]
MSDQFYDARYEQAKRDEKERVERAVEGLTEKYAREISAEYWLGGGRTPEGRDILRSVAKSLALNKLEELSRGGF